RLGVLPAAPSPAAEHSAPGAKRDPAGLAATDGQRSEAPRSGLAVTGDMWHGPSRERGSAGAAENAGAASSHRHGRDDTEPPFAQPDALLTMGGEHVEQVFGEHAGSRGPQAAFVGGSTDAERAQAAGQELVSTGDEEAEGGESRRPASELQAGSARAENVEA